MQRNKSLDTIRGIAIFLVIIAHYFSNVSKYDSTIKILGNYDINLGIIGRMGVMLFFFLSGFLIFHSLQNKISIIQFYKKRVLRIYPPYLFSILFYFFISYFIFDFMPLYDFNVYLINILMLQDIFSIDLINGVYWSLLIEVKFYIIIPFIFLINKKYTKTIDITFVLMLILNLLIFFERGYGSWLLTWMPLFWMGIYLYNYLKNKIRFKKFILIFFILTIYYYVINEPNLSLFLLLNICIFIIIYKNNISNNIIGFYGKISYSFYLLHTTISYPFFYYITLNYTEHGLWIKLSIAFILSTIVSYLSFKYIENFYFKRRDKM